jgi:hypothetical protein
MKVRISARHVTNDDLIADLARVAAKAGTPASVTRATYDRDGNYNSSTLVRRLGSWDAACRAAGLSTGRPDLGHSDDAWMQNIFEVWIALGRQPSYGDIRSSRFSPDGYAYRFGSWTKALIAFQGWVDAQDDIDPVAETDPANGNWRPDRPPNRGRTPSLRLRWQVLERDRFTCVSCGASPATALGTKIHVDHVVPFSKDGRTELDNLQTLCDRCNYGKTDLT